MGDQAAIPAVSLSPNKGEDKVRWNILYPGPFCWLLGAKGIIAFLNMRGADLPPALSRCIFTCLQKTGAGIISRLPGPVS